jgi:hypothetical protein
MKTMLWLGALGLLISLKAAAIENETCTWELKDELRVEVKYEKEGDRYLRNSVVTMTFLSKKPRKIRHLIEGQKSYWYVRARDSEGNEVTDQDVRVPPVLKLRSDNPERGKRVPGLPPSRVVKKGDVIVERLEWDRFLIRYEDGKYLNKWDKDKKYSINIRYAFLMDESIDIAKKISSGMFASCRLRNVKIVVD